MPFFAKFLPVCAYTGSILAQNDTSDVPKHSVEESGLKNEFSVPRARFLKKKQLFFLSLGIRC